jgi:hypothetical protein
LTKVKVAPPTIAGTIFVMNNEMNTNGENVKNNRTFANSNSKKLFINNPNVNPLSPATNPNARVDTIIAGRDYIDLVTDQFTKLMICDEDRSIYNSIVAKLNKIPEIDVSPVPHISTKKLEVDGEKKIIEYSYAEESLVTDIFPQDDTLVIVYDNKDEDKINQIISYLEKDEHVTSIQAYGNTLGAEMSPSDISSMMGIPEVFVNTLFYMYMHGMDASSMTLVQLTSFLSSDDFLNNEMFSSMIDEGSKAQIQQMKSLVDALDSEKEYEEIISKTLENHLYNIGCAGAAGADYILKSLVEKKKNSAKSK